VRDSGCDPAEAEDLSINELALFAQAKVDDAELNAERNIGA
jgi:hypothetical protein